MKKTIFFAFLIPFWSYSQVPAGYYDGASGLTGFKLKSKLHEIISDKNINWHYNDLKDYCNQTDIDQFYDFNSSNTTYLLDIYSNNPTGITAYHYTSSQIVGSAAAEGQGWNREHMMPQSTFDSNYPMYSDMFFVIPTDARINQLRSNYPYGISSTIASNIYYNFTNSSKIGKNAIPNSNYTGRVYEPIDTFKGDVARSLLYFAVRYEGKLSSFKYNNNTNPASDTNPLTGTEEKAFEDWYIAMLLQWHTQDPVSPREIARNNAVYALQKNRNPFIDHPEFVAQIWGQTADAVAPSSPSNLTVSQTSAYFVTLNWTPSSSSDVVGYKIFQDGQEVGYTHGTVFYADHLTPSTSYNFTVKAYDDGYLYSPNSNAINVSTLASDVYAKDLMVGKYLEGTSNNKALEIVNKTGHPVNLDSYRLSIQYPSSGNYYFPAPYEFGGVINHNESFVVINPTANFSCFNINQAKFVTAAPQMTFTGSQYLELRYKDTTVDAIGISGQSNSSILGNVSLYRKASVNQPNTVFSLSEWTSYASNYCTGLGVLSTTDYNITNSDWAIYPNPVTDERLYVKGNLLEKTEQAQILDSSGKLIWSENQPFKSKNFIPVQQLEKGVYLLNLDKKVFKFIKK